MVKHLICRFGRQEKYYHILSILMQNSQTHCLVCGGFGHRHKQCATYIRIQKGISGNKVAKTQWAELFTEAQDKYSAKADRSIPLAAAQDKYSGTFRGGILKDMILCMNPEQ
jgi:hypothetical protein